MKKVTKTLITSSQSITPCTLSHVPVVGRDVCCFPPWRRAQKYKKKKKKIRTNTSFRKKKESPAFPNVVPNFLFARTISLLAHPKKKPSYFFVRRPNKKVLVSRSCWSEREEGRLLILLVVPDRGGAGSG